MSFSSFLLTFNKRTKVGRRFNVKLRKENNVPAIIYHSNKSIPVFFDVKDVSILLKMMSVGLRLIKASLDGNEMLVLLKDYQNHPYKKDILHFDFQKVEKTDIVNLNVFFRFLGERESAGIKQGGFLIKYMSSVLVRSLVSEIPNYIDIDLSKLSLNESIFLSDIKLSSNVILPILYKKESSSLLVASIVGSRASLIKDKSDK